MLPLQAGVDGTDTPQRPGGGGVGHDPALAQRVLGADGGRHHGWPDRGDGAHTVGVASDVRGLVPGSAA